MKLHLGTIVRLFYTMSYSMTNSDDDTEDDSDASLSDVISLQDFDMDEPDSQVYYLYIRISMMYIICAIS